MSKYKLAQGDCLELFSHVKNESIDLIVTDPPYLMNYQSHRRKDVYKPIENDGLGGADLIKQFLKESYRVLKNDSAIYCFCSWHNVDLFKQEFEKYFKLKNILIWNKNNHGSGDLKGAYAPKYEMILYGHKGRSLFREKRIADVIDCAKISGAASVHPTEKPVELLEIFIRNNSDTKAWVLDPFMGSGSTGVATIKNGRNFIGFELEKEYFEIAKERIKSIEKGE